MTEMTELGSLLRQERERQGLSHDEIARRTKVAKRTLLAIESGDKEELPHPVYAKGFVKTYARTLGLDAEGLGRQVDEAYAEEVAEHESAEIVVKGTTPLKKRGKNWGLIIAVLLMLVLGAGGAFLVINNFDLLTGTFLNSSEEQAMSEMTIPAPEPAGDSVSGDAPQSIAGEKSGPNMSDAPDSSDTAQTVTDTAKAVAEAAKEAVEDAVTEATSTVIGQEEGADSNASTVENVTTGSGTADSASGQSTSPSGSQQPASVESGTTSDPAGTSSGNTASNSADQAVDAQNAKQTAATEKTSSGADNALAIAQDDIAESAQDFTPEVPPVADEAPAISDLPIQRVRVLASGDCWIEAGGQGLEKKSLYLRDGQSFVFTYTTNLIVKLGNSGVIKLLHNGKPYPFDGENGKVKYVEFGEER